MRRFKALIAIAILIQACDSPGKYEYAQSWYGKDMADMADVAPDLKQCQPLTACPADACGQIDDQCGGKLSCGDCPCQNNEPISTSCGPCNLGLTQCDTPTGSCALPPLPNLASLECGSILYINASVQNSAEEGTIQNPYLSLNNALKASKIKGDITTLIVLGDDTYEETVTLQDGINLVGGFDPDGTPNPQRKPTITGQTSPEAIAVIGVDAQNISTPTLFAHFSIKTKDALEGQHNYGLRAINASNLIISNIQVQAGAAGKGTDGERGEEGADGGDGQVGAASSYQIGIDQNQDLEKTGTPAIPSDNGGTSTCGAAGGAGGAGSLHDGVNSVGPKRGSSSENNVPGGASARDYLTSFNGAPGSDGPKLTSQPIHGQGGRPLNNSTTQDDHFYLSNGDGLPGDDGASGQGGGGGGGSWGDYEELSARGRDIKIYEQGNQGGGGGAGGCGGKGGIGGKQGGSSIALFLVKSNDIQVKDSSFIAGRAGNGGDGGLGGLFGLGGKGGEGANTHCSPDNNCQPSRHSGGRGGAGSDGQLGGNGGGGSGGMSFGAFCWLSTPKLTQVELIAGQPGKGGNSTPQTSNGLDGQNIDAQGCE